jgi:subtilisin family serine protease
VPFLFFKKNYYFCKNFASKTVIKKISPILTLNAINVLNNFNIFNNFMMITKKHLLCFTFLCFFYPILKGQQLNNRVLIVQMKENVKFSSAAGGQGSLTTASAYFRHLFRRAYPISVEVKDSIPCLNAYFLEFSAPLPITNNCDSLEVFIQSGKPHTPSGQTDIQGGSWNEANMQAVVNNGTGAYNPTPYWQNKWGPIISMPSVGNSCPVTIAVLDTGLDPVHKNGLSAPSNVWFSKTTVANISKYPTWQDGHGHGTHVSGIIGNITQQYPLINLVSIKTQDNNGAGTIWDAIKGIEIAVNSGASIVNMSLIYHPTCTNGLNYDDALKATMHYCGVQYNMLFVTAAGNQSLDLNPGTSLWFPSMFNLPNQINVAAHDASKNLAPFSNYGNIYVNTSSDGVDISSSVLNGAYQRQSGTSMAAPHVAAIAGIIKSNYPACSSPVCGVKATRQPHFLLIKNCILNSSEIGALPSTNGIMQPYFAKECRKNTQVCNCNH